MTPGHTEGHIPITPRSHGQQHVEGESTSSNGNASGTGDASTTGGRANERHIAPQERGAPYESCPPDHEPSDGV